MTIPSVTSESSVQQINQLGSQLASLRNQRYSHLSRIDSIGNEMRETVGPVVEIMACKLKVIASLLDAPDEERDLERAQREFRVLVDEMKIENVTCYQSLLDARPGLIIAGQFVKLTKEKKHELMNSFMDVIDHKIEQNQLLIDPTTNLQELQAIVTKDHADQMSVYDHLLDSKTSITSQLGSIEESYRRTKEAQNNLLSSQVSANIWQAAEYGDFTFIEKKLTDFWFDYSKEAFVNQKQKDGYTPLCLATSHGHFKCVKFLLASKANPVIVDSLGYQPLHWAAKKGHVEIGIELLKSGANVHARGEYGRTPLHMAAHNGHVEFAELLLNHGADINAQADKDDRCVTPLHEAVQKENISMIMALTKVPHLNVNLLDFKNHTPLYYLVCLGRSDLAAMIVGHLSWSCPKDPKDPNHISQLLKIKPVQNQEQMKKFLEHYSANSKEETTISITTERDKALQKVKNNGMSLQHLPEAFRQDKEIVLAAVQQNRQALEFVSKNLKDEIEHEQQLSRQEEK
jgi:hypothetical protein